MLFRIDAQNLALTQAATGATHLKFLTKTINLYFRL